MVMITPQRPAGEIVRFEAVEANRVLPSHRPGGDFRPSPTYPEGVQERAYHLDEAEQAKVVRGAQSLNPELVLAKDPSPLNGPPIVTEARRSDGMHLAVGGNGRTMMIQRAYEANSEGAAAYRKALIARAAEFGFDPKLIRGAYERPILVRVIEGLEAESPVGVLVAAVRRTNESLSQALDAKTLGVAQARALSPESVAQLGALLAGDDGTTLREAMRDHPDVFRRALERDRILTPSNFSAWIAPSGVLTDPAKDQIEAMFLGLVLGTPDRLRATAPNLAHKVERAVPALVAVRGQVPSFDLVPFVQHAVDVLNEARRRDLTLEDLLAQPDLLSPRHERPEQVVELARLFDSSGQRQVAEAFARWSRVAIHDPNQGLLFGSAPTPESAFHVLMGGRLANPQHVEVRTGPRCERCKGTGRIVPWAGKVTWCPTCDGEGVLLRPPAKEDPKQRRLLNPKTPKSSKPGKTARKVPVPVLRSAATTTGRLAGELLRRFPVAMPRRLNVHLGGERVLRLRRRAGVLVVLEEGVEVPKLAAALSQDLERRRR